VIDRNLDIMIRDFLKRIRGNPSNPSDE